MRRDADLSGYYARDEHRGGYGDDYARERPVSHRGRGPKNYRRPDERIAEDVNQILTDDPDLDATEIEVRVENGEITLLGKVGSRWEKRHAENLADRCAGVRDIHNRLTILEHIGKASE